MGKRIHLFQGVKLSGFDTQEQETEFPFRGLVGQLKWLATQTWLDISNRVRAVARFCASRKKVHWMKAIGVLAFGKRTSHFDVSFQRGMK